MKEVIAFAVVLFAVFQLLKTEPPVKEVIVNRTITQEKPIYVERPVVVKEPEIIEKTTERIIVVPAPERAPINYYPSPRARMYPAVYETEIDTERRTYRENKRQKTSKAEIDYECSLKAPNFLGVENKCQAWRKEHGYDY